MFGLMKTRICSQKPSDREARRLAYCGTCKTLGARYGQRTRLLLNHDAVFLAELMEALEPGSGNPGVDSAFRSYSCLSLPSIGPGTPVRLRYAAATTVFLTEAKVADRMEDAPTRLVDAVSRAYARPFLRAAEDLAAWGAPVERIRGLLRSQGAREKIASAGTPEGPASAVLAGLAEPTAESTGLFFERGAHLAGRPDAAEPMLEMGRAFGNVVYLLDALEDFEKDSSRGEFNAFRAAYSLPPGPLREERRPALRQAVWSAGVAAADRIEALPIPGERKALFAARLRSNLSTRLGEGARASHSCEASDARQGEPGRTALGRARAMAEASLVSRGLVVRAVLAPLYVLLALPLALFLPSWARPERGLRESFGLVLNLMFAGGVVRALVSPLRFAGVGSRVPPPPIPGAPGGGTKGHGNGGGGGGEGGGCCCGDGCCDGCDCGDCCSGGCDC
jgi:hypothetical protein